MNDYIGIILLIYMCVATPATILALIINYLNYSSYKKSGVVEQTIINLQQLTLNLQKERDIYIKKYHEVISKYEELKNETKV
jgi:hypothetical protein